jgi:aminoglycoside 6-adenylyltransferase
VLFADGTDLDLIPVSVDEIRGGPDDMAGLEVLSRGFRVLLDPTGLLASLPDWVESRARTEDWPPSLVEFENLVSDFWYHALWTARKLRRGERWVALWCLDGYMKARLLTILEWQARSRDGGDADPWFGGRFLERWAGADVLEALRDAFARYDPADITRALRATMDLFRRQATDLAVRLELPYPARADEVATQLVEELLA